MTFAKLIKSSSLVLLLTIASTSNAFSTSGSSAISSSSSSSGKSSSDLGSSESRSYSSHANSGEASSVAAAQTAALYSLSKAMASALAATRQNADAAAAVAASHAPSSASSSHGASASNIEESSEEYVPKRKTVILAIPVKLALQQAAAAAAMANERSPSAPTHLPSSAAYGNTASAVYSNVQHAPQQQSQLVSYAPQSYQVQAVATASPAPITVRQPVVYASAPPPAPVTYTAPAPVQAAPVSHQPERPTYSDKSPAKFENEVDSAYVDAQTGSTYSGNAQSYENASPVVRSRGPTAASAASVDPSEYETEEVPVNVSPVRKNKKAKQVYYLDEQSEGEDAYATLPKSLKIKSPYAAASSAASLEGLEEFTDAYSSATGLRNAAAGLNGEEDYASALAGASALYPQSTGDLSSHYLKSSRHNSPYAAAAANAHSAYSFGALGAPATGYPRASSYGFPRAASSHRPLYSPGSSPYSTSSAHFKPTYSGSPFGASSAPRMYLPSASSPYKSYFNPGSAMPFASSSPYASYASASSSSPSVSSPFASSSSGLSSFPGLRIGGSNGISIPAGNKGVRIGPLEFSSGGSSSIFPTIKIKSPTRSI